MLNAFPVTLENDIKSIFEIIKLETKLANSNTFDIVLQEERIHIPNRIYYEEPDFFLEIKLTDMQRQILDCYFTRHHNGYIRQKRLNNIFDRGVIDRWIIPYVMKLVGEYIIEILEDIYDNINLIDQNELIEFINKNPKFVTTTEGRISSYWGEYYRSYALKNEYVGFKINKYIQSLKK